MLRYFIDLLFSSETLFSIIVIFIFIFLFNVFSATEIVGYYPDSTRYSDGKNSICANMPWAIDVCHEVDFSQINIKDYIDKLNSTIAKN
mgnify:CR=1 FL=1